jgi:hypothetical protein
MAPQVVIREEANATTGRLSLLVQVAFVYLAESLCRAAALQRLEHGY